jgi:hypothetical protein
LFVVIRMPVRRCGGKFFRKPHSMHFKRITVTFIKGDILVLMAFARALSLLLPLGCLASR